MRVRTSYMPTQSRGHGTRASVSMKALRLSQRKARDFQTDESRGQLAGGARAAERIFGEH